MPSHPTVANRSRGLVLVALVVLLMLSLPLAVWLDLRNLSETALLPAGERPELRDHRACAASTPRTSSAACWPLPGTTQVIAQLRGDPRRDPDPGHAVDRARPRHQASSSTNIAYRFVSDYPFRDRAPHALDAFERRALAALRADPNQLVDRHVRTRSSATTCGCVAPVIMGAACVSCHNTHPDSPKRDWKVGDVRGIQEVTHLPSRSAPTCSRSSTCSSTSLLVDGDRHHLHRPAAAPGGRDPRHEPRARDRPTSSWRRCR